MRIPIREQLALLVLLTSLLALAVVSITTWYYNYNFVVGVTSTSLSLTASLKAAQVASDLQLLQSTCTTVSTRVLLVSALERFYAGNNSDANWSRAVSDVQSALATGGYSSLLQVVVYSRNTTGNNNGLLNITGSLSTDFVLPYTYPNGTAVNLGDPGLGYPPNLYPNITYTTSSQVDPSDPTTTLTTALAFPDFPLNLTSVLLLGPMQINTTFALVSITVPIITNMSANADTTYVLGYMTVVADGSSIYNVLNSREGLGATGVVLLLGPATPQNQFPNSDPPATGNTPFNRAKLSGEQVNYVLPPTPVPGQTNRHPQYNTTQLGPTFPLSSFPAALDAFATNNSDINNASSDLQTNNEQDISVAVGYARPQSSLVDWVLLVEQDHAEAWQPVNDLRKILLGCVFGAAGLILLLVLPMAHFSVLPIRRLKDATRSSVQPPGYSDDGSIISEPAADDDNGHLDEELGRSISQHSKRKHAFIVRLRDLRRGRRRKTKADQIEDRRRRSFKIPGKVQDKHHFITDELTELTTTFNEMSDELMMQYERLEERVQERTQELEISKKAAEAANESKTLFIANISHELKTPLNGILGMCAVCMGEDDLPKIKRSLQVVYKSGDLLLHLLNDLLTFSKNQIGQALSLEEKEFPLADIKSQISTVFDKQVREGNINFSVKFINTDNVDLSPERGEKPNGISLPALGPPGTGRLKDMRVWGDQHRILQVIINLVSNSLKFTPPGGRVDVRIKCIGEAEREMGNGRSSSAGSKPGSERPSRSRKRLGSGSNTSINSKTSSGSMTPKPMGTALSINPMGPKIAQTQIRIRERSPTPPPVNARTLIFEFEVEDTGPGISPALQERVFEPFVQGDLGLSKKHGGTGLGLSICSQLAGLMGGRIALESTEGVGSTFNMQIPLKFVRERAPSTASSSMQSSRAPSLSGDEHRTSHRVSSETGVPIIAPSTAPVMDFEKDPQPRLVGLSQPFFAALPTKTSVPDTADQLAALNLVTATKATSGKIRVLVAEDNLVNQEVVLRMLKLEDIYDVTVARDGQEAFDMVKASMATGTAFNLIFMDIQMPNLDGLQSTRLIRQMGYNAPIVALTAFAEESNVKECMDSGMDMFLSKPIKRPALKQVLKKFATIPEEPEPSGPSRRGTLDEGHEQSVSPPAERAATPVLAHDRTVP